MSKKVLVSNDLIGVINEVLLGRVDIEQINKIYATNTIINTYKNLKDWEDTGLDYSFAQIRDDLWECRGDIYLYLMKVEETTKKLLKNGKIINIDKRSLEELPTIKINNEKYAMDSNRNWCHSDEEFCAAQLVKFKNPEALGKYFPEYKDVIDKTYPLVKVFEDYLGAWNNVVGENHEIESQKVNILELEMSSLGFDINTIPEHDDITPEVLTRFALESFLNEKEEITGYEEYNNGFQKDFRMEPYSIIAKEVKGESIGSQEEVRKFVLEANEESVGNYKIEEDYAKQEDKKNDNYADIYGKIDMKAIINDGITEKDSEDFSNLNNKTVEELEEYLQTIKGNNSSKREEIRRIELINKIKEAQQEGKELDNKIREAKIKKGESR